MKIFSLSILLFSLTLAAQARDGFPELCDESAARNTALEFGSEKYGACSETKTSSSAFGHPTAKFQVTTSVIMSCTKKEHVKVSVRMQADAKNASCVVLKTSFTRLPGQYCGLTNSPDESWKEIKSREIDLGMLKDEEIEALPTIVKQQIIITAKEVGENIRTTKAALDLLKEGSEGGDVYYNVYRIKGRIYNEVKYYPGGNPSANIFTDGSLHLVASNGDDDILCSL